MKSQSYDDVEAKTVDTVFKRLQQSETAENNTKYDTSLDFNEKLTKNQKQDKLEDKDLKLNSNDNNGEDKIVEGKWIGIDLGTSNCCCAVWDTQKHKAKIVRINYNNITTPEEKNEDSYEAKKKSGYLIPSVFLFHTLAKLSDGMNEGTYKFPVANDITSTSQVKVNVGYAVIQARMENDSSLRHHFSKSFIGSIKRILGVTPSMLQNMDEDLIENLPFSTYIDNTASDHEEAVKAIVCPFSKNIDDDSDTSQEYTSNEIVVSPQQATSILLQSIKESVENTHDSKKSLNAKINNAVIGVPAHYSKNQRSAVVKAARQAGFSGHVSTLTESTAASLSYGLFVSPTVSSTYNNDGNNNVQKEGKRILVIDIGGGTSDVTIASIVEIAGEVRFEVNATAGNCRLGGNDVDQIILNFFLKNHSTKFQHLNYENEDDKELLDSFREECCKAKEKLCNQILQLELEKRTSDINLEELHVTFSFQDEKHSLKPHHLELLLQSFLSKTQALIENALDDAASAISPKNTKFNIHEVILVGGSTNLPPLRTMLHKMFPQILEFCSSVHPMKAVAQGCAIQCAILSKTVPKYELRNIMMLDALPHSIGVMLSDGTFVPILNKNDPLPARNYQTFRLANLDQQGVTVFAVEDVGDEYPLQSLGEFSFLLHRLSDTVKDTLSEGIRSVDIGMTVDKDGKFIVSIFDWNDPEHLMKKKKYLERRKNQNGADQPKLGNAMNSMEENVATADDEKITMEQIFLTLACIVMIGIYVAAKITFNNNVYNNY